MVTILISSVFRIAVVFTGEALISMWIPKGTALIRGRRLLEEIRKFPNISQSISKVKTLA